MVKTQESNNNIIAVGIDVSKAHLVICAHYDNHTDIITEIRNNETDLKKFSRSLQGYTGKIIMESTGTYHFLAALILAEHRFDVRVINPLISKKYSHASIRKVKTDKRDACILADIALKEDTLPEPFHAMRKTLAIRRKMSLIASLEKQIQPLQAIGRAYQETAATLHHPLSLAEKQIVKTIARLSKHKEKLERELEIASQDSNNDTHEYKERKGQFQSIPGVSSHMATVATLFFSSSYQESPKQWIAYSGLDVSVKESGTWKGKGKLTKRGNTYLRKCLFRAAWGAMMHDQQFKKYYQYLRDNGRTYVEALVIISRKIVKIMFALSKTNTYYDTTKPVFVAPQE